MAKELDKTVKSTADADRARKLDLIRPEQGSTRSRRVQVLLTPETHDKLKRIAADNGTSVNNLICVAVDDFTKDL